MSMIEISAPVTGTVWKLLVVIGTSVAAEEDLMILESMKMEIPVPAPVSGKVAALFVAEGASVEEGQVVAVVEE